MKLLKYILENAPAYIVQDAVKKFDVKSIGYSMKQSLINEFPEYRGHSMQFGVDLSNEFDAFKAEQILLMDINTKIQTIQNSLKCYNKYHDRYKSLVAEHDALVVLNNELSKPITEFLKLYKKAQKEKGKAISVRKKKEPRFNIPV